MRHQQKDPVTNALAQIIRVELARQDSNQSDLARWTGLSGASITRKLHQGGDISIGEANRMILALGLDFSETLTQAYAQARATEGEVV